LDEEEGGAKAAAASSGWLGRSSCCGGRRAKGSADAIAPPKKPGWLQLQWIKLKLMKSEMESSQDYAMYCAFKIDRRCSSWAGRHFGCIRVCCLLHRVPFSMHQDSALLLSCLQDILGYAVGLQYSGHPHFCHSEPVRTQPFC
jgi:hypothetical protein